jgi:hypothetical protein
MSPEIADRTVAEEYFAVSEKVEASTTEQHTYRPTPRALRCSSCADR